MHSSITEQLADDFQFCSSPRRQTRIVARWANTPALAGLDPKTIIDICERATFEQNPIVAALIRKHQDRDADATTVLMTTLRPMVISVASTRSFGRLTDEMLDNYWAAIGYMLATIDPAIDPVDRYGNPQLFITHLAGLITASRRSLDPTERRWRERRERGHIEVPLPDHTKASHHVSGSAGLATSATAVEDDAIARLELGRIADVVSTGAIDTDRWNQLVNHRVNNDVDGVASCRVRVAVYRTSNHLAALVDHSL